MHLFAADDPRPIHFMGIGGAGMSALALIARRRGVEISGCDNDIRGAADVVKAGARVVQGHDPAHIAGSRAVVYTAAIAADHPELEADEYAKSFLSLRPAVAVITNVEPDHMECYGTIDALEDAFAQFASHAERVLVGRDDPGAMRVAARLRVPVWRVGLGGGDIAIH